MTLGLIPEWAPQQATLIVFPRKNGDFSDYQTILNFYTKLTSVISQFQNVIAIIESDALVHPLISMINKNKGRVDRIQFISLPTNDVFVRDFGPICVQQNDKIQLLDFEFNAWGEKYDCEHDNKLNSRLLDKGIFKSLKAIPIVLEGGSIETNGEVILTTTSCLLNANRSNRSKKDIEANLKMHLGAKEIWWLENGHLPGDDTNGHIDTLARFIAKDTIAYVTSSNENQENHTALKAMELELKALQKLAPNIQLVTLPSVSPKFNREGECLPATYANFIFVNGAVIVPTYRDLNDDKVIEQFRSWFSDREIVAIDCMPLIEQFGALHCASMNLAKGAL